MNFDDMLFLLCCDLNKKRIKLKKECHIHGAKRMTWIPKCTVCVIKIVHLSNLQVF